MSSIGLVRYEHYLLTDNDMGMNFKLASQAATVSCYDDDDDDDAEKGRRMRVCVVYVTRRITC